MLTLQAKDLIAKSDQYSTFTLFELPEILDQSRFFSSKYTRIQLHRVEIN